MLHFTEDDIAELKAIDIRDVLDYYGYDNHKGKYLCPFHDDHKPSMVYNAKKNVVDCYVCNKRWDSIEFVKDIEYKSFGEALLSLVKISGGNIQKYMEYSEVKLPNIRRLKKEERILLEFDIGIDDITIPAKPIKNWSIQPEGDCVPNYNNKKENNFYDGYLKLQRAKLSENYLYTTYPEVYRNLVLAKLSAAISKTKFLYEQGQDVTKEIVILNRLKKDFGYSNQKTQS